MFLPRVSTKWRQDDGLPSDNFLRQECFEVGARVKEMMQTQIVDQASCYVCMTDWPKAFDTAEETRRLCVCLFHAQEYVRRVAREEHDHPF